MVSRKTALAGLAGIVLAGAIGLVGIKSYQSAREKEREQKEYKIPQEEKDPRWQTIEEFEGFTYVSPHKLTREEVKENLRSQKPGPDVEDPDYSVKGIPAPKRRNLVTEGPYKGKYSGITRDGETYTLTIMDSDTEIEPKKVLQVSYFNDGSSSLDKVKGIEYNRVPLDKIIQAYKDKIPK